MQRLGGSDEDRRGGFVRGGWAIPLLVSETGDYLNQVYGGAAAFLFGRRTYETGDDAAAAGDLKTQHDGGLLVPGSGALVRWLLANGLVDQFDLLTYPVVGQGIRLFPGSGQDTAKFRPAGLVLGGRQSAHARPQ
ncbi:MAG TPA: hypothetical protein DEQ49_01510 [Arthrobacter bacterium]|nr:hypothetical protein [Arthrobacter sp.]HCC38609.1 hypothetical protein [Arthrobacter sp.]